MKISAIETIPVFGGGRDWVFVRVHTDDGLIGTGEGTLEGRARTIVAAVNELSDYLVGEDPFRIEHLWQVMYRHAFYRGGPVMNSALSGVEQALWDILGQALKQPVHQLLGGRVRDKIRVYANGPRGETPEEIAESALALKERGFSAMKLVPFGAVKPVDSPTVVRHAVTVMESVRAAVGPEVDLMVDAHGRLSPTMAIQIGQAIKDVGILFFEEPCLPENRPRWDGRPRMRYPDRDGRAALHQVGVPRHPGAAGSGDSAARSRPLWRDSGGAEDRGDG